MLNNIEEDPDWERHTRLNARVLKLLTDALTATAEELFPCGVPANNQMKGIHWNSKNCEITRLIGKRGALMRKVMAKRHKGPGQRGWIN